MSKFTEIRNENVNYLELLHIKHTSIARKLLRDTLRIAIYF